MARFSSTGGGRHNYPITDRVAQLVMQIKVCIYYVQIIIGESGITLEQCPGFHHLLSLDVLVPHGGTSVGVVWLHSCLLCLSAQVFAWKGNFIPGCSRGFHFIPWSEGIRY